MNDPWKTMTDLLSLYCKLNGRLNENESERLWIKDSMVKVNAERLRITDSLTRVEEEKKEIAREMEEVGKLLAELFAKKTLEKIKGRLKK